MIYKNLQKCHFADFYFYALICTDVQIALNRINTELCNKKKKFLILIARYSLLMMRHDKQRSI